ncbi:MAG: hypothetical protein IJZ00_01855 [Lachnospiraceae bacterium]|nr:hypothetical protein [Lachnospiraceae bacterium]
MKKQIGQEINNVISFLLITIVLTMGVMVGCDKEVKTPDSENDITEIADVTEDTEEPESEDAEAPVEVVEPELGDTEEPEESLDYIVREDGRIQPAVHYASAIELVEFVDSLELEEAVILLYDEETNLIVYSEDSFTHMEGSGVYLYVHKEISNYNSNGISIQDNLPVENLYGLSYNEENGSREFSIQLEYADGTTEEFSANLIIN